MPISTTESDILSSAPLRCLIVDDDPLSVQVVSNCISNTPFLEASAACTSAIDAAEVLRSQAFDVLFLDVEMPLMSGLDLLRALPDPPQVVLITGSQSYAIQAFEFAVADYLLKPLSYPRFLQAANKVLETITAQRTTEAADVLTMPAGSNPEFTFVKVDNKLVRVDFTDVFYVEALGDYVHLVTSRSKLIVYSTMRAIEEKFPSQRFVRVHRSFIINIDYVQTLEDNSLLIKDKYIPVGQTYMRGLLQRLNKL
jgi:two-component system LytT family response regulator